MWSIIDKEHSKIFSLNFHSHRNVTVRKTTAQFLSMLADRMGPSRVMSGAKDVTEKILPTTAQFLTDGGQETRCVPSSIEKQINHVKGIAASPHSFQLFTSRSVLSAWFHFCFLSPCLDTMDARFFRLYAIIPSLTSTCLNTCRPICRRACVTRWTILEQRYEYV